MSIFPLHKQLGQFDTNTYVLYKKTTLLPICTGLFIGVSYADIELIRAVTNVKVSAFLGFQALHHRYFWIAPLPRHSAEHAPPQPTQTPAPRLEGVPHRPDARPNAGPRHQQTAPNQ